MPSPVEGEEQPGPILSILSARQFDLLLLIITPHTRSNEEETRCEVEKRHPSCHVRLHEIPVLPGGHEGKKSIEALRHLPSAAIRGGFWPHVTSWNEAKAHAPDLPPDQEAGPDASRSRKTPRHQTAARLCA